MATLSKINPFNYIADSGPERFAVGRVNILLAKIFAIGGLAVGLQMLLNAWSQRDILSPWFFWSGFLMVGVGQLGLIYGAFVSGHNRFWQRWYARSIEGVIMLWFLGVPAGTQLPEGFYPWAWWGVGLAAVAAFSGLPPFRAILLFVVLDIYWFIARFFPAYGAVDLWLNIQDTLLTFLFAALLGSLILVTRYEASKVDDASNRKIAAAADQARAEAAERERDEARAALEKQLRDQLAAGNPVSGKNLRDVGLDPATEGLQQAEDETDWWSKPATTKQPAADTAAATPAADNPALVPGTRKLIEGIKAALHRGKKLDNPALDALASQMFGSGKGSGKWTSADAYDAAEAALNSYLLDEAPLKIKELDGDPKKVLAWLRSVVAQMPRQTARTAEKDAFQQFSTPPTEAYLVALAANIKPGDVFLEPSAGVGSLAVWAKIMGATVHVNEIAPRRAALLKAIGFDRVTSVDGEALHGAIWRADARPRMPCGVRRLLHRAVHHPAAARHAQRQARGRALRAA